MTPIDLDPILASAKAGDVVTLAPALYLVSGCAPGGPGVRIPAGVTLQGSPGGETEIWLRQPDTWTSDMIVLGTAGDGCTVRDFTINPGPAIKGWKCNLLSMVGNNHTATRINAVGAWGWMGAGREGFAIHMTPAPGGGPTTGSLIQACRAVAPQGDYVTALKVDGGSITQSAALGAFWNGLGFCRSPGATITDCVVDGAVNGVYTDTGESKGVVVTGCWIANVQRGVCVRAQVTGGPERVGVNGLVVRGNTILLRSTGSYVAGLELDNSAQAGVDPKTGTAYVLNVEFSGNRIGFGAGGPGAFSPGNRLVANIASALPPANGAGVDSVLIQDVQLDRVPAGLEPWKWRNMGGNASRIKVLQNVDPGWIF